MNSHDTIASQLYDYVKGDLPDALRIEVEQHCAGCPSCAGFVARLRTILEQLPGTGRQPADERTPEFWNAFADRVEEKISASRAVRASAAGWHEALLSLINVHWKPVAAVSAAVSVMLMALTFWLTRPAARNMADLQSSPPDTSRPVMQSMPVRTVAYNPEVGEYLRRSKMLLIGVTNMKLDDGRSIDLSTEQELSRRLLHEARDLGQKPLDLRSARIVEDVRKILVDLSNIREDDKIPGVEIVRAGIHNENLLFKIRIAEAQFDSAAGSQEPGGRR